jgi:hypothetical protein
MQYIQTGIGFLNAEDKTAFILKEMGVQNASPAFTGLVDELVIESPTKNLYVADAHNVGAISSALAPLMAEGSPLIQLDEAERGHVIEALGKIKPQDLKDLVLSEADPQQRNAITDKLLQSADITDPAARSAMTESLSKFIGAGGDAGETVKLSEALNNLPEGDKDIASVSNFVSQATPGDVENLSTIKGYTEGMGGNGNGAGGIAMNILTAASAYVGVKSLGGGTMWSLAAAGTAFLAGNSINDFLKDNLGFDLAGTFNEWIDKGKQWMGWESSAEDGHKTEPLTDQEIESIADRYVPDTTPDAEEPIGPTDETLLNDGISPVMNSKANNQQEADNTTGLDSEKPAPFIPNLNPVAP